MTKILFILSILVMGAGGYFAYENGRRFADVRLAAGAIHSQIKTELRDISGLSADVNKVKGQIAEVQVNVDTESEKLKGFKIKASQLETESRNIETDFKAKTEKMAQLNTQLIKLPAGFNPKTIAEDLNKIRQEIVEFQTAAETKKGEVEKEAAKVAAAQRNLDDIKAKVEARKKSFERNALEATIVAVNPDWGFVVVNAGDKEGITPSTKLIVIRGTQTVGKLNILSVDGKRTVANVLGDSLAQGMSPLPGDKVILETLVQ